MGDVIATSENIEQLTAGSSVFEEKRKFLLRKLWAAPSYTPRALKGNAHVAELVDALDSGSSE